MSETAIVDVGLPDLPPEWEYERPLRIARGGEGQAVISLIRGLIFPNDPEGVGFALVKKQSYAEKVKASGWKWPFNSKVAAIAWCRVWGWEAFGDVPVFEGGRWRGERLDTLPLLNLPTQPNRPEDSLLLREQFID